MKGMSISQVGRPVGLVDGVNRPTLSFPYTEQFGPRRIERVTIKGDVSIRGCSALAPGTVTAAPSADLAHSPFLEASGAPTHAPNRNCDTQVDLTSVAVRRHEDPLTVDARRACAPVSPQYTEGDLSRRSCSCVAKTCCCGPVHEGRR